MSEYLERDGPRRAVARTASLLWASIANPVRPVALPPHVRVVGVGGSTLGGSYKTPLTLALAIDVAMRGRPVAVAVHGYGARGTEARRVASSDDVRMVGDDALLLARELAGLGVPVVVGRGWSETIALAARFAPLVIVDGLLQTSPQRLDTSFLVVDALRPWGSGWCPPGGDLRAPRHVLLSAADAVVEVVDAAQSPSSSVCDRVASMVWPAQSEITAVKGPSSVSPIGARSECRAGLLLAIARPERVLGALRARGIDPVEVRFFGDHARPTERPRAAWGGSTVDHWLTTRKCATKLGPTFEDRPVLGLEHRVRVPHTLVDRVLCES